MSDICRRSFVKGAGALGTAALAAGLGGAKAAFAETAFEALPDSWDYEADVVIVGYGVAGAAAAREAIAEGVSCIVLEKCDETLCGGSGAASAGAVFPNSADEIEWASRGYVSRETIQAVLNEGVAIAAWLDGLGMDRSRGGVGIYESVKNTVDDCGVTVLYETPGKRLIADPETHEVFGVQAIDATGAAVNVKANKGVILATGGFLGNTELVHRFIVPKEVHMVDTGAPTCTGDGLLMGLSVGAALKNLTWQCLENYGQGSVAMKTGSDEMGCGLLHLASGEHRGARIYVNSQGKRFMDEDLWYCHSKDFDYAPISFKGRWFAYQGFANLPMYLVFDSQLMDEGCIGPHDATIGWANAKGIYNWSADNKAELEKGWIAKGDTIEELVANLAQQSGHDPIDAAALTETLETYNGYCADGIDADFHRAEVQDELLGPSTLETIDKPPYYACEIVPSGIYTIGGLHWGENGSTLDWDGSPIPGLYHAGDVGQFTEVTVLGLQDCMGMGSYTCRTVCAQASREIPGEATIVIEAPTEEMSAKADVSAFYPTATA